MLLFTTCDFYDKIRCVFTTVKGEDIALDKNLLDGSRSMKKVIALIVAAMMLFSVLAVTAFAADKITITVDVYDVSTNTIYRNVGTDTVNKGTFGIESENYRIP